MNTENYLRLKYGCFEQGIPLLYVEDELLLTYKETIAILSSKLGIAKSVLGIRKKELFISFGLVAEIIMELG